MNITDEQHTALLAAMDALDGKSAVAMLRGDLEGAKHLARQWQTLHSLIEDAQ